VNILFTEVNLGIPHQVNSMTMRKNMFTIGQMRRKYPAKLRSAIAKMHIDHITKLVVRDVDEVRARIHRIVLFCPRDEKPQGKLDTYFKRKFEKVQNIRNVPKDRLKGYRNQLRVTNNICTIDIFINRIVSDTTGYFPVFRIELVPNEGTSENEFRQYLVELDKLVFHLHPSTVEYTLDLFCNQPWKVESLFLLVKRSLYVPYQNNPRLFDNYPVNSDDEENRINSTFYAGDDVKIYERGNDDKKEKYLHKSGETKEGWQYINLNRLRLEHTADRTKLMSKGVNTLSDFIKDCRFHKLNADLYKFRSLMSRKRPNYWTWPSYSSANEFGHKGAFQFEYVLGKLFQTSIRQSIKDVQEFNVLQEKLIQQMLDFDTAWRAGAHNY